MKDDKADSKEKIRPTKLKFKSSSKLSNNSRKYQPQAKVFNPHSSHSSDDDFQYEESKYEANRSDLDPISAPPKYKAPIQRNRATSAVRGQAYRGGVFDSFPNSLNDEDYSSYTRQKAFPNHTASESNKRKANGTRTSTDQGRYKGTGKDKDEKGQEKEYDYKRSRHENGGEKVLSAESWTSYLRRWKEIREKQNTVWTIETIPWPVLVSTIQKPSDICKADVYKFLKNGSGNSPNVLRDTIRNERTKRWHPDKFRQITTAIIAPDEMERVMPLVTTVAQILNEIWEEFK